MTQQKRKHVIFVGVFKANLDDGTRGGVATACRSLVASSVADSIVWYLIDSSAKSQPPPVLLIRFAYALKRVFKLVDYLVRYPVDSVLIFSPYRLSSMLEKGLMCVVSRAFGKQVILSLRSEIKDFAHDRWLLWYKNWTLSACHAIICQSEIAAGSLTRISGYSAEKIHIIPNWIVSSKYRDSTRRQRQDHAGLITFLYVGWLEEFKGFYELLDAANHLTETGIPFRLVLGGGGSARPVLEQMVRTQHLSECVNLNGWVSESALIDEYWNADIFVFPSRSEGFPNALLEAMAAGLPVIATSVGSIPDTVIDGLNGLLIDVNNPSALAQAMLRLYSDEELRLQMGQRNARRIAHDYDASFLCPKVINLL